MSLLDTATPSSLTSIPNPASTSTPILFPRVIDATMRSTWKTCPHKFFREHVQGIARHRPNIHLHFGGCVARGLEVARRSWWEHRDSGDAVRDALEAVIHAWGTDFDDFTPRTRTEANKTISNALLAIERYFYEWPLGDSEEVTIHTHNGEPCIEFSAAAPIPGSHHPDGPDEDGDDRIAYAGRFDFIGDYLSNSVYGVDDKTASVDPRSDGWRQQWKLRGQFSGYTWLAREYGVPLTGFIVRGIGVMKEDIRCSQVLVPRPAWMVDAWLHQLQDDVRDMCAQYATYKFRYQSGDDAASPTLSHPFPQDFDSACADFGGCSFLDLCASEHPDDWLSEYVERRWNPLTRTET